KAERQLDRCDAVARIGRCAGAGCRRGVGDGVGLDWAHGRTLRDVMPDPVRHQGCSGSRCFFARMYMATPHLRTCGGLPNPPEFRGWEARQSRLATTDALVSEPVQIGVALSLRPPTAAPTDEPRSCLPS